MYGVLLVAGVIFGLILGYCIGGQSEARTLALVTDEIQKIREEVNGAPGYRALGPDIQLWVSRTLDRLEKFL